MAVLITADRQAVSADFQRDPQNIGGTASGVAKTDLQAAVNAVDQWIEDNSSSFNLAIPQPARGALTARQKAALLMFVVDRRFQVS